LEQTPEEKSEADNVFDGPPLLEFGHLPLANPPRSKALDGKMRSNRKSNGGRKPNDDRKGSNTRLYLPSKDSPR
jgi:hypothetical protein